MMLLAKLQKQVASVWTVTGVTPLVADQHHQLQHQVVELLVKIDVAF